MAHSNAGPVGGFFTAAVRRDPRRLMDLLEVRRALEVHIASLAATRGTRATVAAMELALAAMREAAGDPAALHEADIAFHASVASAAGNQMLSFLIEAMEEPLRTSRMRSMQGRQGRAAAMLAHLEQTARDLKAALALVADPPAAPG